MTVLTPEQIGLRESVRALLAKRCDPAAVRAAMVSPEGVDRALWVALCDQIGVAALSIPERFGGIGATPLDLHVVLEELGRALTPSPMLGSAVLAAQTLLALDDEDANTRLLPALATGASTVSLCWAGESGRWDPAAAAVQAEDGALTGSTHFVLDAATADVLLVVATVGSEIGVFEVAPDATGVTRTARATMDLTRRLSTVQFERTPGRRLARDSATPALAHALGVARIALSAEQVGGATRILESTVAYAKVREQFGRPIGSFQALKHRMADLYVLAEAARSASYGAAAGTVAPAVAKAYCSEAYFTIASAAIQLHGGIAITWEHDAHLYFKRAQGSAQLFGAPSEHLAHIATLAGLEE
ncbi:MAG: acyl-CoA/acyl-ACP dehydrogenase [Actinomycetota bacterium]|nr:acyl-CoA/acyl-ACP dehydrogenase [Actinomycetota bacterium]